MKGNPSDIVSKNETVNTIAIPNIRMANALKIRGCGSSLPKAVTWVLPLNEAKTATTRTARVLTFIPPAVEAEAPPMNINPVRKKLLCCSISPKLIVVNPAVRPLTE